MNLVPLAYTSVALYPGHASSTLGSTKVASTTCGRSVARATKESPRRRGRNMGVGRRVVVTGSWFYILLSCVIRLGYSAQKLSVDWVACRYMRFASFLSVEEVVVLIWLMKHFFEFLQIFTPFSVTSNFNHLHHSSQQFYLDSVVYFSMPKSLEKAFSQ